MNPAHYRNINPAHCGNINPSHCHVPIVNSFNGTQFSYLSTAFKQIVLQFILSLNPDVYQLHNLAKLHYSLGNVATGFYSKGAMLNIFNIHKCTASYLISVIHACAVGLDDIVQLSPDTITVFHYLIQLGPC